MTRAHAHIKSVGLLWTTERLVAEDSTWQHTIRTRNRHPCPGLIRTRNPNKRGGVDTRLRPHGLGSAALQIKYEYHKIQIFSALKTSIPTYTLYYIMETSSDPNKMTCLEISAYKSNVKA